MANGSMRRPVHETGWVRMIIISVARMFILFFLNQSVHALHDKPSAACKILKDAMLLPYASGSLPFSSVVPEATMARL